MSFQYVLSVEHTNDPEAAMLIMVAEANELQEDAAKGGIGTSTPGVANESIPEKGMRTGRTSNGLRPSQGDNLELLSVLFLIESRYSTSLVLAPFPDAAATGLKLADAFLLLPVAEPEVVVRVAELADATLTIELVGHQVGAEDLLHLLARARLGLATDGLIVRGSSI